MREELAEGTRGGEPPAACPPAKVPVKVPYVLLNPQSAGVVPGGGAAARRGRECRAEKNGATVLRAALPAKRPRKEVIKKQEKAHLDSCSGSSSSDDDDITDNNNGSDTSSRSEDDNSSASSFSSTSLEDSESDYNETKKKRWFVNRMSAKSRGVEGTDNKKEEEKEEAAPLGPPPRPPVIRSFPQNIDVAIKRYEERLNREENMIRIRDDNKAVSLGTSKINYIDPRIVCSWAKQHNVPIGKIFSATIQKKFPWALGAENFLF